MPDEIFDWDAAEQEARADYLALLGTDTRRGGQPYPEEFRDGAREGWDAAVDWVKRTALLRMLSGPTRADHDRCRRCGCRRNEHGPGLMCPAFEESGP
jgi:hypothetical protein